MKILVTANHVPFIQGGAEHHVANLAKALQAAGHEVEVLRLPFRFSPDSAIEYAMEASRVLDMHRPNGITIDRVISLQFPGWGVSHPDHRAWVMHQHRAVYDLATSQTSQSALGKQIHEYDNKAFAGMKAIYANSARVAERLLRYNGVRCRPLYHPPPLAEHFYQGDPLPYVFMPGRMETLKRHTLLIEAMARSRSNLFLLLAGTGGQALEVDDLIANLGLGHRVRMLGHISDAEKVAYYARATAVCCTAYDEDYGYVPLEAMLAGKPILVCRDGGGLLEFVRHEENGWVVEPSAQAIAEQLDWIARHPAAVQEMGVVGRKQFLARNITWPGVVEQLLR